MKLNNSEVRTIACEKNQNQVFVSSIVGPTMKHWVGSAYIGVADQCGEILCNKAGEAKQI